MAIQVREEIVVRVPRERVAAFMFDPKNERTWLKAVLDVKPLGGEGRLHQGSRVRRTASFLGREFSYEYEVTGVDGDTSLDMRVERPFPMQVRYELQDVPGGTRVSMSGSGEGGGLFRFAGPLLGRMVRKNMSSALEELKAHLERQT